MNADRWERINGLLLEILPLSRAQRAAVLNRCGDEDRDLRDEVESLLHADDSNQDGFLASACPAALGNFLDVAKWNGRTGEASGRLVGRYQLHCLIGEGGTSEVYRASLKPEEGKASNGSMPQQVAFKLMSRHMATGDALGRFQTERRTLASIDHPCVASYHDSGLTDDGLPYLVMELIEGQRIDLYCDEKQLSVRDRVMLLLQVTEAVDFIHQRGVLHRDLTPPNILITSQGVPKLVDFGIARSVALSLETLTSSSHTATWAILGTPEYLSPEQAKGRSRHADIRTDVYILGALLYRLLTGRTPFQGVSLDKLLEAILQSDPVPPSRLNSGIVSPLETICLTCLQKDPLRRYGSAKALTDDLRRWLDGRPIEAQAGLIP